MLCLDEAIEIYMLNLKIMRFRIPSFEIPTITNVCVWIYLHSLWIHKSFVNINHHWLVTPRHCTPWSSTVKPCFNMNRIPAIQLPLINENLLEPDTSLLKLWQQEKLSFHCIILRCTFSISKMVWHVKHKLYLGQATLVLFASSLGPMRPLHLSAPGAFNNIAWHQNKEVSLTEFKFVVSEFH